MTTPTTVTPTPQRDPWRSGRGNPCRFTMRQPAQRGESRATTLSPATLDRHEAIMTARAATARKHLTVIPSTPDPIFSLIAEASRLNAIAEAIDKETGAECEASEKAWNEWCAAHEAIFWARPKSIDGALAQLREIARDIRVTHTAESKFRREECESPELAMVALADILPRLLNRS